MATTHELTYLDHAATTPMRHEAISAMQPFLADVYANPAGSHRFSRAARTAIDEARDLIAELLSCRPGEVVFTSGGTEADNAAVFGAVRRHGGVPVCSAAEHHAVLHCVEHLGGYVARVDRDGVVDLAHLQQLLEQQHEGGRVAVVSVMAVNNEVGSITPIREVAKVVRASAKDAVFHTDAVQAACWLDLADLVRVTDAVSLSAHKFGGPKGMGVMVVKQGTTLEPLIMGGGQERDRRSGTSNVAGIVATAAALRATVVSRDAEVARVGALRGQLVGLVLSRLDDVIETVPAERSVPGIAHFCFGGIESEALLFLLDEAGVCASAASACASGAMEPSHVLSAMGIPPHFSKGALRLSLGHTTTSADVDRAVDAIVHAVQRLRR